VRSAWTGLLVAVVVLLAASAFGLARRVRDGRLRTVADAGHRDLLLRLGVRPDTPVTLLQFSSAICAPCRATARLCAEVATATDGVHHVDVDAAAHLDAVRALGIMRTPTLLVVDSDGRIVRRAAGQPPTRDGLTAAVNAAMAGGSAR
jgi:thiol-disulfide isomerase/thioredoxin